MDAPDPPLTPREIGRRWFEEIWNGRNTALVYELMAPDAVGHLEGGQEIVGPEAFLGFLGAFVEAVPDLRVEVVNTLADGDEVCIHWHARGTHTGRFAGTTGQGARLSFRGTTWLKTRDGRVVEGWDFWNMGSIMQAMGATA